MQAFVTDLAELAEDLEIGAGSGQHGARLEQQLIEVAVKVDALGFQDLGHRGITTGFMNAVFLVDVHCVDFQLLAQLEQDLGCLIPAGRRANQQRDVQGAQRMT